MQYAGLAKSNSCAVEESLDSLSWMDPGIVLMTAGGVRAQLVNIEGVVKGFAVW